MQDIHIEGLSPRQWIIADMVWACGTREDIDRLIKFLPTQEMKDEATVIVDLMMMAMIEQCFDGSEPMQEAEQLLKKIAEKT